MHYSTSLNNLKMKTILFALICGTAISCTSREKSTIEIAEEQPGELAGGYDSLKAASYGADDYGMKKYVMAFLRKGPNRDLDSAASAELQMAHLKNINRMAEEGTLVLAGPFFGDGDIRGIYVFNVQSIDEAKVLTNTDPAVLEGSLEMELIEWYGSAALMEIGKIHETIMKKDMVK